MPTTITSAGITFNDATSLTSANIGTAQLVNGSVTASKLGTTEQTRIAKAWVNFDGTLATPITPRASYNVSSVTKNGTGDYTVNFTTAMADANYSVSGLSVASSNGTRITYLTISSTSSPSVNAIRINNYPSGDGSGAFGDTNLICIQVFGN